MKTSRLNLWARDCSRYSSLGMKLTVIKLKYYCNDLSFLHAHSSSSLGLGIQFPPSPAVYVARLGIEKRVQDDEVRRDQDMQIPGSEFPAFCHRQDSESHALSLLLPPRYSHLGRYFSSPALPRPPDFPVTHVRSLISRPSPEYPFPILLQKANPTQGTRPLRRHQTRG